MSWLLIRIDSQLPNHIESYHSLVPLDTNHKGSTIFGGYTSWVYKAQSSANGHFFALRRIEGDSHKFTFQLLQADMYCRLPLNK